MPKYVFKCKCGAEKTQYAPSTVTDIPCEACSASMERQLPNITGQEVRETVDSVLNTKWKQDHQEMIRDRRDDHYWTHEVPRLVEKYSLETCLEQGWLVYNDKKELVINKPPRKR